MFVRISPAQPLVWGSRFLGLERGKRGSVSAVGFVVFLGRNDLPLNRLRACNVCCLVGQPLQSCITSVRAMVSHWMALKLCAAEALMSARHKESHGGDAAHAFEDH
jgi:hypothetical protein